MVQQKQFGEFAAREWHDRVLSTHAHYVIFVDTVGGWTVIYKANDADDAKMRAERLNGAITEA